MIFDVDRLIVFVIDDRYPTIRLMRSVVDDNVDASYALELRYATRDSLNPIDSAKFEYRKTNFHLRFENVHNFSFYTISG